MVEEDEEIGDDVFHLSPLRSKLVREVGISDLTLQKGGGWLVELVDDRICLHFLFIGN